jgi:hypothetical protein
MTLLPARRNGLILASDFRALGFDTRPARRAIDRGDYVRVRHGAFVEKSTWEALKPGERHRLAVVATSLFASDQNLYSHYAAAAMHGIPIIGSWPQQIDVITAPSSGGHSRGMLRRRALGAREFEHDRRTGLDCTTPAQTAIDLAMVADFATGVAAIDRVLWHRSPLASLEDLHRVMESVDGVRGFRKAERCLEFATSLADTPLESLSRVNIHLLGYPAPILQHPFVLDDGSIRYVDFWWPDFRVIGEADGAGKYLDPALRRGRSADQVVYDEKLREDDLRRQAQGFARWDWTAALVQRLLAAKLDPTGLPRR